MTVVTIGPERTDTNAVVYRAASDDTEAVGNTAGQALDAITPHLPSDDAAAFVIVQHLGPDRFFSGEQLARLDELMARWRTARDNGGQLPPEEQAKLDELVAEELDAARRRAEAFLTASGSDAPTGGGRSASRSVLRTLSRSSDNL